MQRAVHGALDKIDLTRVIGRGKRIAVQRDDRGEDLLAAAPELEALVAMARVLNARAHLAGEGHADGEVRYALGFAPTGLLREALVATGAALELPGVRRAATDLGPGSLADAGELADRCFTGLAARVKATVGSRDPAMALRMLEDQTLAAPPARDDEARYWRRVLELAALAGEVIRARYPGRWVHSERGVVPFGFLLDGSDHSTVMFPANRAQRLIEDGGDESLFKLVLAVEESVLRPVDAATGRLMPSLRDRRTLDLDEVVWRPLVPGDPTGEAPVVVFGLDGEHTFGMMRRAAQTRSLDQTQTLALRNLADEEVTVDRLDGHGRTLLLVNGGFYAAEKLLDVAFMRGLHRTLDAALLAVATPTRGLLMVVPAPEQPDDLARFAALSAIRHREGGGRGISPTVMLVEDGEIIGFVSSEAPADPDGGDAPGPAPRTWWRRLLGRS